MMENNLYEDITEALSFMLVHAKIYPNDTIVKSLERVLIQERFTEEQKNPENLRKIPVIKYEWLDPFKE